MRLRVSRKPLHTFPGRALKPDHSFDHDDPGPGEFRQGSKSDTQNAPAAHFGALLDYQFVVREVSRGGKIGRQRAGCGPRCSILPEADGGIEKPSVSGIRRISIEGIDVAALRRRLLKNGEQFVGDRRRSVHGIHIQDAHHKVRGSGMGRTCRRFGQNVSGIEAEGVSQRRDVVQRIRQAQRHLAHAAVDATADRLELNRQTSLPISC